MDPSTAQLDLANLAELHKAAQKAWKKAKRLGNNNPKKKQAKEELIEAEENLKNAQATSSLGPVTTAHKSKGPLSSASSILTPCSSEANFPGSDEASAPGADGVDVPPPASAHGSPPPETDEASAPAAAARREYPAPDVAPDAPGANGVPVADAFPIDPKLLEAPGANVAVVHPLSVKRKLPLEGLYTINPQSEDEQDEDVPKPKKPKVAATKKPKVAVTKPEVAASTRAKKAKPPLIFSELPQKDQDNWTALGRKAVNHFLNENQTIPVVIRGMARRCQAYLPEAATSSAPLAKEFLRTGKTTYKCLYHYTNRHEILEDDPNYLMGIPGPVRKTKKSSKKKKKASKANEGEDEEESDEGEESEDNDGNDMRHPGSIGPVFSCGCTDEDAVFSFFLWKTSRAFSTKIGCLKSVYRLGTLGETHVPEIPTPRMRSFWHQSIRDFTGIRNLLLFFAYWYEPTSGALMGHPFGSTEYQIRIARMLINAQKSSLEALNVYLNVKDVPPPAPAAPPA